MTESMSKKFAELKMTKEEVEKFTEAMKKEEFRKLLIEYAEELSDPKNRELYEKEISLLEEERGNDVIFIHPDPGFCLKTTQNGEKKCFINICKNENVAKPTSSREIRPGSNGNGKNNVGLVWSVPHTCAPPREDIESSNNKKCIVYDVVFHPDAYRMAETNQRFHDLLKDSAMDSIEKNFEVKLDRVNVKVLKNLKFKGRPTAAVIRKPNDSKNLPKNLENDKKNDSNDPIAPIIDKLKEDYLKSQSENRNSKSSKQEINDVKVKEELPKFTVPIYKIIHRGQMNMEDCVNQIDNRIITSTRPKEIFISIELPLCKSSANVNLDIFEKRLFLESNEPNYQLDLKLPYPVKETEAKAKFDKSKRCLNVTLQVIEFIAKIEESSDSALCLSDDSSTSSQSSEAFSDEPLSTQQLQTKLPTISNNLSKSDIKYNLPVEIKITETLNNFKFFIKVSNYVKESIRVRLNTEAEFIINCESCNLSSGYVQYYSASIKIITQIESKLSFNFISKEIALKEYSFNDLLNNKNFYVKFYDDEIIELIFMKNETCLIEANKFGLISLNQNEKIVEIDKDFNNEIELEKPNDLNSMTRKEFVMNFKKNLSQNMELDEDDLEILEKPVQDNSADVKEDEEEEEGPVNDSLLKKLLNAASKNSEEKLFEKRANVSDDDQNGQDQADEEDIEESSVLNQLNSKQENFDSCEKDYINTQTNDQQDKSCLGNDNDESEDEVNEKEDKVNDRLSLSSSSTNFTLSSSSLNSSFARLRGILKKPRSVSESESIGPSSKSFNQLQSKIQNDNNSNSNSEESINAFKKSVSFSKQVIRNVFKPGSTVIGMKKPNSNKNKKKNKRKRTISDPSHNASEDASRSRSRSISESSDDNCLGSGTLTDSIENLSDDDKSNEKSNNGQKKNNNNSKKKNNNKKNFQKNVTKKTSDSKFMSAEDLKRELNDKNQNGPTKVDNQSVKSPLDVETMLKWKAQGKMPHQDIGQKTQGQIKFVNKIMNDLD